MWREKGRFRGFGMKLGRRLDEAGDNLPDTEKFAVTYWEIIPNYRFEITIKIVALFHYVMSYDNGLRSEPCFPRQETARNVISGEWG